MTVSQKISVENSENESVSEKECGRNREREREGKVIFQWLSSLLYRHFLLWPLKITHRKTAQPGLKEWTVTLTHTSMNTQTTPI